MSTERKKAKKRKKRLHLSNGEKIIPFHITSNILRFLDFFVFVRKLDWWHFCSSGGRRNSLEAAAALHSGRVVVNLSNSKRRRLVKNSAFAFRYFGSRHKAVKTFGLSDDGPGAEPLTSFFFSGFFAIFLPIGNIFTRKPILLSRNCLK